MSGLDARKRKLISLSLSHLFMIDLVPGMSYVCDICLNDWWIYSGYWNICGGPFALTGYGWASVLEQLTTNHSALVVDSLSLA